MKKIFIADDDSDILEILRLMLESQGYQVQVSTNANDIFKTEQGKADLILLDIWMSGIDGRDICHQIQKHSRLNQVPIVFISANSHLKEIAEECNVYGYIEKPFDMEELLTTVKNVFA